MTSESVELPIYSGGELQAPKEATTATANIFLI
jgi:hypothetical protein